MSTPVRVQDREHFAIVRESLARDGLHVAMVAHDRGQLQSYAGALARALASDNGLRVEAYNTSRLESVVVDLMLHRFDAALSDISRPSAGQLSGLHGAAGRPGCVMFVPEAQALPRAEFRQLLRIAAGTHRNGLRLVALFDASSPDCEERIAEMGTQIARWDLDEEAAADHGRSSLPISGLNTTRLSIMSMTGKLAGNSGRWLAAAGVAAMLALLPAFIPLSSNAPDLAHTDESTLTRSGMVELAGEPRQDFVRAQQAADDARVDQAALRPASADSLQGATDIVLHDTGEAHGTSAASSPEAGSR